MVSMRPTIFPLTSASIILPSRAPEQDNGTSSRDLYCLSRDEMGLITDTYQVTRKKSVSRPKREIDGYQAWFTLTCIFLINANTLGSLKIYGLIFEEIVAQNYYNRQEASWPISTASTIQNLAGILTPMLALKVSWRSIEISQTVLIVLANVGAYLSNNLILDILCLGILQGVALSLRYNMNVVINNEYFVKYRATAMGVSLAGSTCGVFVLKPIITYVLDSSNHNFRNAYLALALIMSVNIVLNFFIRKPNLPTTDLDHITNLNSNPSVSEQTPQTSCLRTYVFRLIKNPSIHCIWIMQTIYFYISRTYTIFIVDYGVDKGFTRETSRSLLEFWVYGEIAGRLLLGSFVDSRILSMKWNIVIVNLLVSISGYFLLVNPSYFGHNQVTPMSLDTAAVVGSNYSFYFYAIFVALVAALSSLVNMLIVPFGQEYLGKKNVPWAFAIGSIVTSVFLLLRPTLIGLSRDTYKSYNLLIIVMSTVPFVFSLLFALIEPILCRISRQMLSNELEIID